MTVAKRGLANGAAERGGASSEVRVLAARRLVMQDVQDREVVTKLFDAIAPRFASRPGGYTRLLRIGFRKGDSAEMAQVELVGSEFNPKAKTRPNRKKAGNRKRRASPGATARRPSGSAATRTTKKPRPRRRPNLQRA